LGGGFHFRKNRKNWEKGGKGAGGDLENPLQSAKIMNKEDGGRQAAGMQKE